jgi:hypothetical protein
MSNKFEEAVRQDIAQNYDEAIKNYEDAIFENEATHTDAFTNLAFIYWSLANEPPFAFEPGVSDRWSIIAGERFQIILEIGIQRQPDTLELIFWKRYFAHIVFGEDFTPEECKAMIESHSASASRVPYFFLWLFDKKTYLPERAELLIQCEKVKTAKNRYIASVLSTKT